MATPTDQYTTRHNPFVWFHSIIDNTAECNANVVPLGTLGPNGMPAPTGHLADDLQRAGTTPRFGFITPNLCNDGHDDPCAGPNSTWAPVGGLVGADQFLRAWMPLILVLACLQERHHAGGHHVRRVRRRRGSRLRGAACCRSSPGPTPRHRATPGPTDAAAPGGGQIGALLLNARYVAPGSTDTTGTYNHYSALRSYEDLLGLTTGGNDGQGHLGFAAQPGLAPFGTDVFSPKASHGSH